MKDYKLPFDSYIADRLYDELEPYGCICAGGCYEGSYYVSVWADMTLKDFKRFLKKVKSIEKEAGIDIVVTEQQKK